MHDSFRKVLILALSVFTIAASPSDGGSANGFAADLEVDNVRGSDHQDQTNGARVLSSFRTLQAAIDHALIGDSITIRDTGQPYRECVSIHSDHPLGTEDFPFIIEGNGATFDGTRPLGVLDWSAMGGDLFEMRFRSPGHVKILAANDQPIPENRGHLADLSRLEPFQYARNMGSVFFKTRPGDAPQAYGLRVSAEQTGLTLYEVSHVIIRNVKVNGYRLDGINCHDLVDSVRFENVVATNNGRSGISVGGASHVTIQNAKAAGNAESQIRTEGQCVLRLINVTMEANGAKELDRAGGLVIESQ